MLISLNFLWKLPGQPGQLAALCPLPGAAEASPWCLVPRRRTGLPARPAAEGTQGQKGRHRHGLSPFARYSEMLMFHSSAEQNEMLTTWNFPQNRRFLFRPALTYTHARTHICRIINCYVMTPDYMPTSTVWYGGNPALKTPVLEQPPESHGAWKAVRWHNAFFMEQPWSFVQCRGAKHLLRRKESAAVSEEPTERDLTQRSLLLTEQSTRKASLFGAAVTLSIPCESPFFYTTTPPPFFFLQEQLQSAKSYGKVCITSGKLSVLTL